MRHLRDCTNWLVQFAFKGVMNAALQAVVEIVLSETMFVPMTHYNGGNEKFVPHQNLIDWLTD